MICFDSIEQFMLGVAAFMFFCAGIGALCGLFSKSARDPARWYARLGMGVFVAAGLIHFLKP